MSLTNKANENCNVFRMQAEREVNNDKMARQWIESVKRVQYKAM